MGLESGVFGSLMDFFLKRFFYKPRLEVEIFDVYRSVQRHAKDSPIKGNTSINVELSISNIGDKLTSIKKTELFIFPENMQEMSKRLTRFMVDRLKYNAINIEAGESKNTGLHFIFTNLIEDEELKCRLVLTESGNKRLIKEFVSNKTQIYDNENKKWIKHI